MFGCSYLGDGNYSNNVQSVTGQSGTFAEAMSYNYLYGQGPDSYVDIIGSSGGTIFFRSQDNNGRALWYNGIGGEYRAIHSTFMFGALRDGTDDKSDLMVVYMDYLTETIGVEELADVSVHNLSLFPNPVLADARLSLTLAKSSRIKVKVYSSSGQLVRDLADLVLSQGNHTITWDGQDNLGRRLSNGTYIISVQIDEKTSHKTLVLVK